jgi:hypothetical protein
VTSNPLPSRRTVAKGIAWTAPVVAVGVAAPFAAASPAPTCQDPALMAAVDTMLAAAQSQPLVLNLYQSSEFPNSTTQDLFINLRNDSSYTLDLSQVTVTIDMYHYSGATGTRLFGAASATSWGTLTTSKGSDNLGYAVWKPGTSVPPNAPLVDGEADASLWFNDSGAFNNQANAIYYSVTGFIPLPSGSVKTLAQLGFSSVSPACQAYYDQKVQTATSQGVTTIRYDSPKTGQTNLPYTLGTVLDSAVTGNWNPLKNGNGIF